MKTLCSLFALLALIPSAFAGNKQGVVLNQDEAACQRVRTNMIASNMRTITVTSPCVGDITGAKSRFFILLEDNKEPVQSILSSSSLAKEDCEALAGALNSTIIDTRGPSYVSGLCLVDSDDSSRAFVYGFFDTLPRVQVVMPMPSLEACEIAKRGILKSGLGFELSPRTCRKLVGGSGADFGLDIYPVNPEVERFFHGNEAIAETECKETLAALQTGAGYVLTPFWRLAFKGECFSTAKGSLLSLQTKPYKIEK